jgi:hypothetical protein
MRVTKHHLGIGFEVWNNQQSWFWYVDNTNRNGTIGAAASESDAIAEAHSSIEEISNSDVRPGWECSLGKLARYLSTVCDPTAYLTPSPSPFRRGGQTASSTEEMEVDS